MGDAPTITITDKFAEIYGIKTPYDYCVDYAQSRDSKLGQISDRGPPLSVAYPVESTDKYKYLRQIEDQVAIYNRPRNNYDSCLSCVFDNAILDTLPIAIDAEDLQLADFDIADRYFYSLIIKQARSLTSNKSIADHLQSNERLANYIGFESIPKDQSTFWHHYNDIDVDLLAPVVSRLVHAAHRNGMALPERTRQNYNLDNHMKIDETDLSQECKNTALRHWMDEILDNVFEPISFNRAENISYSIDEIIGATALAALVHGPYAAPKFGSWLYEYDEIISGNHLYTLVKSLSKQDLDRIFKEINDRIVRYASEIGFLNRTQHIALDTTWVTWSGAGSNDDLRLINNPERCASGRGWCFAALALMFNESRFVLGIDLVQDKSDTIDIFRGQLRDVYQTGINIGRIHTDREFYAGDTVQMCRAITGDDYAIRIKLSGDGEPPAKVQSMDLSSGDAMIVEDVDFAGLQPKVNVCGQAIPENSEKSIDRMGFLTDMTKNDVQPSSLYHTFNNRWSIESFFNQLKNGLAPNTKSPDPMVRLFFFRMGAVFYNIHVLVNRARSPKYGYRLNEPYYQVLMAIADSIFTRK